MKDLLFHDEEKQKKFEEGIKATFIILEDALKELQNQGVQGLNCEKLKGGKFVDAFENFHKEQQAKSNITKPMLFDKYLELYGYKSEQIAKLEDDYNRRIGVVYSFYGINDAFYKSCKALSGYQSKLKQFFNKAPRLISYSVFDFLTVRGNTCQIEVSKELFTLYATNDKQLNVMGKVKSYVQLAKELDIEYKDVLKPIEKYLDHKIDPLIGVNKRGLSHDMKQINFDYNKILTIE
ncbi:hypothetical protein [Maribacter aquivivus]|uniref:hypothetical protein n=1 Tax=Maribacter aquivivus TaxID=228958 RepID=UPI002490FB79|nr:hypothetical protein [Maribacter aquivivus]